jgi:hypothetical protein
MTAIKRIQSALDMITNHQRIVSLSALREEGVIRDHHFGCFASQNNRFNEQLFVDWLQHGMYDYAPTDEVEENDVQSVVEDVDGTESESEKFDDVIGDMEPNTLDEMLDFKDISKYSLHYFCQIMIDLFCTL